MNSNTINLAARSSIIALAFAVTACGDNAMVMEEPIATPTPAPVVTTFDVTPCLDQVIPGTGGVTVAQAVVPDTLTINLGAASGFPNGRRLEDPVIDVTLAVIFLDLGVHSPATLAGVPVNPPANDVQFQAGFPYLAPAQGSPAMTMNAGSNFAFNDAPMGGFIRVDRMGMPAVSTALIGSDRKNDYNDASPADDANGDFVGDLSGTLTALTGALADDLTGLGLTPCATASS